MSGAIYLREASLPELLQEVARRFEDRNPIPEWAAPVMFAVAAYYGIYPEQLRSNSRDEALVKSRHLAIALLAQLHPSRSRAEVCALFGRGHEIYAHALSRTDERSRAFPEFRTEIREVLQVIRETSAEAIRKDGRHTRCRTSPQGTSAPSAGDGQTTQKPPTPAKIGLK